ncbi:MAG: tyrosine-type recombinase/integrase [Dehalococcoidia bacterium]
MAKDDTPLEKLAQHFEAYNRSEGKSPRTIEWYSRVIKYLTQYLERQGYRTQLGEVNIHVVREFILYLQTKTKWSDHPFFPSPTGNLAAISVQTYVRGLRAFFGWLHKEGYTEENLLADLKPPKAPQKMVEVLKENEISKILSCLDSKTASGCRNTAIVIMMLDTGLRLSELTNLKMENTHIEEGYVKSMGKGSKERIVPIGGVAQKVLLRYVFHFRTEPLYSNEENLFLTLEGRPSSSNAVRLFLSRLGEKSGVKRFHAHLCRHTFATNYLLNGGDVFSLQQILGHTSLEMVKRYVTLVSAQVRVQHRKFSPMDRMNLGRVMVGRMTRNGPSNGNGLAKKRNAVKYGS